MPGSVLRARNPDKVWVKVQSVHHEPMDASQEFGVLTCPTPYIEHRVAREAGGPQKGGDFGQLRRGSP
jgi:hypothetical protein